MASPLPAVPRLLTAAVVSSVAAFSALVLGSYFLLNSSLGPSLVQRALGSAPVEIEAVRWGPSLDTFALLGVRATNIHGATTFVADVVWMSADLRTGPRTLTLLNATVFSNAGRPGIAAKRLTATLDPSARALGAVRIASLSADDYALDMRWGADGEFNLSESFAFTERSPEPPVPRIGPDGKPMPPDLSKIPWLQIDAIVLAEGTLRFQWPGGYFKAEEVTAKGAYGSQPWLGLLIDADLDAGATQWAQDGIEGTQRWDQLSITGYRMRGMATTIGNLDARVSDRHHVRLSGLRVSPNKLEASADLALQSMSHAGVTAVEPEATLSLELTPNRPLPPTGWVKVEKARAERLAGPGWAFRRPLVKGLMASSESFDATVSVPEVSADRMRLEPGVGLIPGERTTADIVVRAPKFSGEAAVSGTTATFSGKLTTPDEGAVNLDGSAHLSLLRQEVEITFKVLARALSGGLLALLENVPVAAAHFGAGVPTRRAKYRTKAPLAELLKGQWRLSLEQIDPPPPVPEQQRPVVESPGAPKERSSSWGRLGDLFGGDSSEPAADAKTPSKSSKPSSDRGSR